MVEIYSMTQGHCYWNETLSLAANCSWKAGSYLAERMMNLMNGKECLLLVSMEKRSDFVH